MTAKPDADTLLASVADFLRREAMPRLSGHAAFGARVAANAIDLVRRELAAEPFPKGARLASLLGHDGDEAALERELAASLRSGARALGSPGVAAYLWDDVLACIAIDQPAYASREQAASRHPSCAQEPSE